ncbi:MAG: dephospho-CoA kinase [Actinomycetota bacterium]
MGLTGGIGSGKSTALAAFARCGAAVLSSDEVVHGILRDPEVVEAVVARFGPEVRAADGGVDRPLLGAAAFASDGGVAFLEGLIHPRVERRRVEWVAVQRAATPPAPLLVCEVPLLFEVGLQDRFDAVLVVTAGEGVRRARVEARGQRFDERRGRQLDEAQKVARADRAYVNDGSAADLERWVAERFAEFAGRPCGGGR